VLRAVMPWALFVAATLLVRFVFDAFVPTTYTRGVIHPRSAIMSNLLIATFAIGAGWHAWRSRRVSSGVLVAVAAAVIGGLISQAGALAILGFRHDPDTLRAIANSGGLDEVLWGVPLLLILIGSVTGTAGALLGRAFAGFYGRYFVAK
jgi:hypothetical protein